MTHPLIQRLADDFDYPVLADLAAVDAFVNEGGIAAVFFPGDPAKFKDTTDVAVVFPEVVNTFRGRLRPAVVTDPATDKALYERWQFGKWPALVFLKDGEVADIIIGIKDWGEYLHRVSSLLSAAPSQQAS
jgi:hydrogenase-1 operon protein HyaE